MGRVSGISAIPLLGASLVYSLLLSLLPFRGPEDGSQHPRSGLELALEYWVEYDLMVLCEQNSKAIPSLYHLFAILWATVRATFSTTKSGATPGSAAVSLGCLSGPGTHHERLRDPIQGSSKYPQDEEDEDAIFDFCCSLTRVPANLT
ncbi:hypothetical protein J3458_021851 [Metarhizium acridum]|uniref:uncharacterized protein n=1 Tax=Metarhizium acridum TaxID=92637 RepID=UPI001C6CD639|nr:hypothetical protein J3458_021851 [Metarhizium acridum]